MAEKRFIKATKFVIMIFLVIYISSSVIRGLVNNQKVISSYEHILQELDREKSINKELQEKIALTEDPEYMEVLARKRLGLVKNDEIVYKIVYKK